MNLSFSALGKTVSPIPTVAQAIAGLQKAIDNLADVATRREAAAVDAEAKIQTLQQQVTDDRNEVAAAKSIKAKLDALLS